MLVTVDTDPFRDRFALTSKLPPRTTGNDIVRYVKLAAEGDRLTLQSTNLEASVTVKANAAAIHKPGSCLIPSAEFRAVLAGCTDPQLQIAIEDDKTRIVGATTYCLYATPPVGHFPSGYAFGPIPAYVAIEHEWLDLITERIASSVGDIMVHNYALEGVALRWDRDSLRAYASDSKIASRLTVPTLTAGSNPAVMPIIPKRTFAIASSILSAVAEDSVAAELAFPDGRHAVLSAEDGDVVAILALTEGTFPELDPHLKHGPLVALLDMEWVQSAVAQVLPMLGTESRRVRVAFSEGRLTLSNARSEKGTVRRIVPTEYGGPEISLLVSGDYLAQVCRSLRTSDAPTRCTFGPECRGIMFESGATFHVVALMTEED